MRLASFGCVDALVLIQSSLNCSKEGAAPSGRIGMVFARINYQFSYCGCE